MLTAQLMVARAVAIEVAIVATHFRIEIKTGHLHNHVGLTENFDQSENEEFLVNDSP